VLLLLHGLGATGDVWRGLCGLLADRWRGRWVIPDLPGHGGSDALASYSFDGLAAAVAGAVPPADRVVILGHSLGGAVALALASGRFRLRVSAVCGLGIKVSWSEEELARARTLSTRPNPTYATRADAVERHLRLAGLTGLVTPDAVADAALVRTVGGWTVAFDPAAFAVGAPDMKALIAASSAAVVLAAGERDPMSAAPALRALVPDPVILPGLGHNAHVEDPAALWSLLERLAASARVGASA
jgi:pimeloyl-ACP methyl ester carboxylesterase